MNIPKRTEHFLAHGAPVGQRHQEYIAATCQLRDNGGLRSEVERLIIDRAQQDGFPTSEASQIVKDVFSTPPRAPIRGGLSMFREQTPRKPVRRPKPIPPPVPLPKPIHDGAIRLIERMFVEGDLVRFVPSSIDEADAKAKPAGKGHVFTREMWLQKLRAVSGDPNRIVRPSGGTGVYMGINPLHSADNVGDSGVSAFRHVMLEWDAISDLGQQWAIIQAMHLPAVAVIHSGGKSLHAILRVDAETKAEYEEITARLYDYASQWKVDQANRNPSRLTRLPGTPGA